MAINNLISHICEKDANGNFDNIFYLSPKLRYAKPLPTSNNNNLEEELLLGEDKIITKGYDSTINAYKQTIEFRRDADTGDYYELEILDYTETEGEPEIDITVENTKMIFQLVKEAIHNQETLIKKYTLFYIEAGGNKIRVSEKNVYSVTDGNGETTIKEVITNYLVS